MKKYICFYALIFMMILVMILTRGLPWEIELVSYNAMRVPDGSSAELTLRIGNLIVSLICLFAAIAVNTSKSNRIPVKWILLLAVIICIGFVPLYHYNISGVGGTTEKYFCMFMIGEIFKVLPSMRFMKQMGY